MSCGKDFFEWDAKAYSLGVDKMDEEHKHLIELMNELYCLHDSGAAAVKIGAQLEAFADFTIRHFKDEEAYMQSINFVGLRSHKLIHEALLTRVSEFVRDFKMEGKLQQDFFMFLKVWLVSHIQGIDTKYASKKNVA